MNAIVPKWSFLAKIQRIRTVKSMYVWLFIVPLIAKALIKVEGVADLTIFEHNFSIQLGLPFSWKVFYFSAISFAAANLVFLSRSYNLIKDHSSFSDFRDQGKSQRQLDQYANEAEFSLADIGYDEDYEKNFPQEFRLEGKHLQDPFWRLYEKLDNARPYWRFICGILYLLGFILISIILYQNIEVVLKMMF